jgi:GT2 family glycosyltransferase
VITIVHGRHEHLRGQLWGLARQTRRPDLLVIVAMGDPALGEVVRGADLPEVLVVHVPLAAGGLPLARARNEGAHAAMAAGADTLVFMDVDCIPERGTIARYADVLAQRPWGTGSAVGPVLVCGEVAYLPPVTHPGAYRVPGLGNLARPHPARPALQERETRRERDLMLFWSLSFAATAHDWGRLGGFCEEYEGYGGEDTDLALVLAAAEGQMWWAGGATAYHQNHAAEQPPRVAAPSIVRNANLFPSRWGWFPMRSWLNELANEGLVAFDPSTGSWRETPSPAAGAPAGRVQERRCGYVVDMSERPDLSRASDTQAIENAARWPSSMRGRSS